MTIRNSLVTLQPGMYILRYPKGGTAPLSISRGPGGLGEFETLATPKTQGCILRDGSDCIVMRVIDASVELLVTAYLEHPGAAIPSMRIDLIGLEAAPAANAQAKTNPPGPKPIEVADKGISIIGHIERIGDVVVTEGQQLGELGSVLRLEGFQVVWPDKPEGLELSYGLTIEGSEPTPMVGVGQFCGTRNMARRITDVTFMLTGSRAEEFALDGIAGFSGGFQCQVMSGAALSGPSGMEHLTSISLRVKSAPEAVKKTSNPWEKSPRTRIFKTQQVAEKTDKHTAVLAKEKSENMPAPKAKATRKVAS